MKKSFDYTNINKYDLISLILEEFKNEAFTYFAFILDTSVPTLNGEDKSYNKCIRNKYKWIIPGNESDLDNAKTKLYKQIIRMRNIKDMNTAYEFYIAYASPYTTKNNEEYIPFIEFVTDDLLKVASQYEMLSNFMDPNTILS